MKTIVEEHSSPRRFSLWSGRWPRLALAACGALLLVLILPLLPVGKDAKTPGVALLAQSVQAMSNLQTVHIRGRIRTLPADNFELIGLQYDFVPIEIWREYSTPPRWRVEKPGRVVAMDGQASLLYISAANQAMRGTPNAGFIEWLRPMLDPQSILERERTAAQRGEAQASITEGGAVTTLVARRQARGNFANDWSRNKSIPESDHTCIYRFDSASKRLEGLQVIVSAPAGDVVVAEFTDFRYDEALPASLYTPQLPADVDWIPDPGTKPAQISLAGPKEAAAFFFDAMAKENWNALPEVSSFGTVPEKLKQLCGGLQVLSLGEPFQSGLYPGYFVPYQVRFRNGSVKAHNLAVRNDNPARRWLVDGGF